MRWQQEELKLSVLIVSTLRISLCDRIIEVFARTEYVKDSSLRSADETKVKNNSDFTNCLKS